MIFRHGKIITSLPSYRTAVSTTHPIMASVVRTIFRPTAWQLLLLLVLLVLLLLLLFLLLLLWVINSDGNSVRCISKRGIGRGRFGAACKDRYEDESND